MPTIKMLKAFVYFLPCVFILTSVKATVAIPVFPGAKGFGTETSAGRGGVIIRVTNLEPSGTGSLRAAVEASGPRIVIFEVSGNIEVNDRLRIGNPFITIAGQTAPSPGITLKNCTLTIDTHDVLIQHLRVRAGDGPGITPDNRDSLNIGFKTPLEQKYNIVIDHCSISWGIDENSSSDECSDVTWSNCIFSEPLNNSLHTKGPHSKTIIIGNNSINISLIDNLIAHSVDRNPLIIDGGLKTIIANNLIYNPGDFNAILQIWQAPAYVTLIGNVVKGGRNSATSAANNFPTFWRQCYPGSRFYIEDNKTDLGTQKSKDDWSYVRNRVDGYTLETLEAAFKADTPPVWPDGFTPRKSSQVEDNTLKNAGARPADRDSVDLRIISDVIHRSGRIIDSPIEVGGFPDLQENRISHKLPSNPNGDDDGDGYTNVEEWLHDLAMEVEATISSPIDLTIKEAQ